MIVTFPSVKKRGKEKKRKRKGKERKGGRKKRYAICAHCASSPDPVAFEIARDCARRQGQAEILHFS